MVLHRAPVESFVLDEATDASTVQMDTMTKGPLLRSTYQPMTDDEIDHFFSDIDLDNDGYITFEELETKLEAVHQEIAPQPKAHHLHHPHRRFGGFPHPDVEKVAGDPEHDGLVAFLRSLLPDCSDRMSKSEFRIQVKAWDVPSQTQNSSDEEDRQDLAQNARLSLRRKIRAHWAVEGPRILFITFVVAVSLALGIWQMVTYILNYRARAALGWGVILSKAAAGAIYPILFFMLLSMSRHFATLMRKSYIISKFVNWDRAQSFHIYMACFGLFFASLHAIGHLCGTFLYGSRPAQQDDLALLLGPDQVPSPYVAFVRKLPGWTGITALGLFYVIAILSLPKVRAWSYELFQLAHLLMFPFIGLLVAHGTAHILQYPMLGYWLVFPTLLIVAERASRLLNGLVRNPALLTILDDDTVVFSVTHPRNEPWRLQAGQYVFLQVPSISFFQWHPFTVSACRGDIIQLHIKTDGDWTSKLRNLPTDKSIRVGIDGPYGAPAQRFYDYDRALIIGAGVGVTPFSAILTDLEMHLSEMKDPWRKSRKRQIREVLTYDASNGQSTMLNDAVSCVASEMQEEANADEDEIASATDEPGPLPTHPARRVDFHWMVRDKNYLLWFSSLLNRAHELSMDLPDDSLDLRITPHITQRRQNVSTHVFRYLLDRYRTPSAPYSALTGLKMQSQFGRPDFEVILNQYHEDMLKQGWTGGRVGVFFCGAPVVGRILADTCYELTRRSYADGSRIRYQILIEVFG